MHNEDTFLHFLKIQFRVVGALIMREMVSRYGRHSLGFLWLFVEPMLFTVGVTVLWTITKLNQHSVLPITAFAITGYSSVLLWRNAANRAANAIKINTPLLYHRYVGVIHVMLARILLEIAGATMSCVILTSLFVSIGWMDPPADILLIMGGWLLLSWFSIALGLVIGSISEFSETMDRLWHAITYLLFPLSGAAYMVDWLPKKIQQYALLVPMVNGVEMIREGFFGMKVRVHYDLLYFIGFCLVLTLIGVVLTVLVSEHLELE